MKRRHAWPGIISAAFGKKMTIVGAIDNDAPQVEEDTPPLVIATLQAFSLWTTNQTLDVGSIEFTVKSKSDEDWAVLQAQHPRLGERKRYRMFIGTREVA
jgi:hypothetical protein